MPPSTNLILAMRGSNRDIRTEVSAWAVGLLEQGQDSPYLRICAGLSRDEPVSVFNDYFDRTAEELGLSIPAEDEATSIYIIQRASSYLRGELPEEIILQELVQLCIDLDYPEYLMPFYILEDERHLPPTWEERTLAPVLRRKIEQLLETAE